MILPDIITIHPKSIDYPIWRSLLEWYSPYFNRQIVAFTGLAGDYDFSSFVREAMDPLKTEFVESRAPNGEEDWRNVAVNQALEKSSSDWVLFLEQDFFWLNKNFLDEVYEMAQSFSVVGFWEANRLHPAFLLVERKLIEKTRKDFGTVPDELDHFGKFSLDIIAQVGGHRIWEFDKHLEMKKQWYHMQGITHNYNLCRSGNLEMVFKRDEFLTYNSYSRKIHVKQHENYIDFSVQVDNMLGRYEPQQFLKEFWEYL